MTSKAELASGLSILCGGTRDDKVRAAFDMFDIDGSGFVTKVDYISSSLYVLRIDVPVKLSSSPTGRNDDVHDLGVYRSLRDVP